MAHRIWKLASKIQILCYNADMAGTTDPEIESFVAGYFAALAKRKAELQIEISTKTGQIRDIDGQVRGMKEHLAQLEAESAKARAEDERQGVTIRAAMTAVLAELNDFTNATLIQEIQKRIAGANPASIISELSKAINERGEAVRVSDGVFKGGKAMPKPQSVQQPGAAAIAGTPGASTVSAATAGQTGTVASGVQPAQPPVAGPSAGSPGASTASVAVAAQTGAGATGTQPVQQSVSSPNASGTPPNLATPPANAGREKG